MSRKAMTDRGSKEKAKASAARKNAAQARRVASKAHSFIKEFKAEYGSTPYVASMNVKDVLDKKSKDLEKDFSQKRQNIDRYLREEEKTIELQSLNNSMEREALVVIATDLADERKELFDEVDRKNARLNSENAMALNGIASERTDLEKEIERRLEPAREELAKMKLVLIEDGIVSTNIRDTVLRASKVIAAENAALDVRHLDIKRAEEYINDTFLNETDKSRSRRLRARGQEILTLKKKNAEIFRAARAVFAENEELLKKLEMVQVSPEVENLMALNAEEASRQAEQVASV